MNPNENSHRVIVADSEFHVGPFINSSAAMDDSPFI